MFKGKLIKSLQEIVTSGYKSNAFSPFVWQLAVGGLLLLLGILFIDDKIITYIFVVALIVLLFYNMAMGNKIFNKDPNLLQSEKYRTNDKILDLVEKKGGELTVNPITLDVTFTEFEEVKNKPEIGGAKDEE